jgi:acetyl esterase/lipase
VTGLLAVFLLLATVNPAPAAEPPGSLLVVRSDASLEPAAITSTIAPLFEGTTPPTPRFPVDIYLIRYTSRYPDDSPAVITAQLFVPRLGSRERRPVYVFAPGSTGLIEPCRPSNEHVAKIRWGLYRSHVLAVAAQSVIAILPDYMGFGDPDRAQPYFSSVAEGRTMLDAIRAVRAFFESHSASVVPAPKAFIAGYSQGGHAAFAAADLRSSYAPDVRIAGIIGYGPTTNPEVLFREFTVVAPLVVYTFSQLYGKQRFDPADILAEPWLSNLENDVTRQCIGGIQSYYPSEPRKLFRPGFADALLSGRLAESFPQIHAVLTENSSGLSGHRIPALILQGSEDIVIDFSSQDAFVRALCHAGSPVTYLRYPGSRHDTRQIGFADVLKWMEELTRRARPKSDCGEFR